MMFAGLQDPEWAEPAGQLAGYAAGGALGGAGLAWGLAGGRPSLRAAAGFAAGFVLPAFFAGPALTGLFRLDFEGRPPAGALVSTAIAFGASYAVAGAVGLGALEARLAWSGGLRFLAAGALGGLVAAAAPAHYAQRFTDPPAETLLLAIAGALLGHLTAFAAGGFLAGRAIEASSARVRTAASPAVARG